MSVDGRYGLVDGHTTVFANATNTTLGASIHPIQLETLRRSGVIERNGGRC